MSNGNDLPTASDASNTSFSSDPQLDDAAREAKVIELRASLEKFEAAKRYTEYAKVLVQLGQLVADPNEAVELLMKAADMFVTRFANQAEAIKLLEKVLTIRENFEPAVAQLRPMYEKRRDWEKLVVLERKLIEALTSDAEKRAKRLELAKLAMDRVKKPEVCVPLWQAVVDDDAANLEALGALAQFHERSRDFAALASTLEAQVAATADKAQRIAVLAKLALVASERLADESMSAAAWRRVLDEDPSDRRAVEALKKKYLQLARFDELEALFEESQKWDELIRLLEGQESREEDSAKKVALLLPTARLWLVRKEKADRARKALDRALDLDPSNVAAAEALLPLVESADDVAGQLRALAVLRGAASGETRGQLALRIGGLEERKGDVAAALEARLEAVSLLSPEALPLDAVIDAAFAQGKAEALLAVLGQRREAEGEAGAFGLAWATVSWRAQKDAAAVAPVLESYAPSSPHFARAVVLLSGIYEAGGQYDRLKASLATALDRATSGEQRRELQLRLARLHDAGFNDPAGAIAVLESSIEEHGLHDDLAQRLAELLDRSGATEKLRALIERQVAEAGSDEARVSARIALATLLAGKGNDPHAALGVVEVVLEGNPSHEAARSILDALVAKAETRDAAARVLLAILESTGGYESLAELHRSLAADDRPVGAKKDHWLAVARIAREHLRNVEAEHGALLSALELEPGDEALRAAATAFAGSEAVERAAAALRGILVGVASDASLATAYRLALADLEERAGRVDDAVRVLFDEVQATHDSRAVERLEALFLHRNDSAGVERLIGMRLALGTADTERVALLRRLARLQEARDGGVDDAVASWSAVLELEASAVDAFEALERIHRAREAWASLRALLERRREVAEGEAERAAHAQRLGDLLAGPIGDSDAAVDAYEVAARGGREDARLALDAFCTGPRAAHFAARLEPLFRELEDTTRLQRTLRTLADASEGDARDERLAELGRMLDADAQSKGAFDIALERLRGGYSANAVDDAERLARRTSNGASYLEALDALAKSVSSELGATLFARAAAFALDELGDVEGSLDRYRSSFELDPMNEAVAAELVRLLERLSRYEELARLLARRAGESNDPVTTSGLWRRVAEIAAERLGDDRRAAEAYQKALAGGGHERALFEAATDAFRRVGEYRALLECTRARADVVADDERLELVLQIANTLETHIGDVPAAIDAYRDALALRSDDEVALGRLAALLERENRWAELAEVLEAQRSLVRGEERPRLDCRLARVVFERLNEAERAVAIYDEVLTEHGDFGDALRALEHMLEVPAAAQAAARVLARVDERAGRLERVARALEVELRTTNEPHEQAALLQRLVRIHEDSLGDAKAAFAAALKLVVVAENPGDALKQAQRLAAIVGGHEELVATLESLAAAPDHGDELRVRWLLEAAAHADADLRDDARAVGLLRSALGLDASQTEALAHLERLYERMGQSDALAATLERHVEVARDANEATALRLRFAALALGLPGREEAAVRAATEVVVSDPSRGDAYELLEKALAGGFGVREASDYLVPWLETAGEGERLAATLGRLMPFRTDATERVDEGLRLAEVLEVRLADPMRAFGVSLALLRSDAGDERTLELAKRLAGTLEDEEVWEKVAAAFEAGIRATPVGERQLDLELSLADLIESELGDISRAEEVYRRAHGAYANDPRPLRELDRIYESLESWEELEKILAVRVGYADNDDERIELLVRLAKTRETHLDDVEGALRAFAEVIDRHDRQNAEALDGLERIYEARGEWEALDRVLTARLETAASEAEEATVRARIADIAAERLGDRRRAIDTWRYVLDLKGEDRQALEKLARLYQAEEDWASVDATLDRLADAVEEDARVNVISQRARLAAEKLGSVEQARDLWFRVLDLDASNLAALRAVVAIDEQGGHPRDLADSILRLVQQGRSRLDEEDRAAWTLRVVHILVGSLESDEEALEVLAAEPLSEVEGDLAEARLELLVRAGRHGEVVAVERALAKALEGDASLAHLRKALEHARAHMKDADLEADLLIAIEGASPTEAHKAELATALRQAKRWEALVELRLAQLDASTDPVVRAELLLEVGGVFEGPLADAEQAFEAYLNALGDDPSSKAAAEAIERVANGAGRWPDVLRSVSEWLAGNLDPKHRLALCLHMARWYGEVLDRPDYARPFYEEVLKLEPSSARALRQMAALERRRGNDAEVESLLRRALETVRSGEERAELLFELGEHFERVREDAHEAVVHYERAFELAPTMAPLVDALVRIHGERGDRRKLAAVLAAKGRALGSTPDGSHALVRAAEIHENDLSEADAASELYRAALEAFVDHRSALDGYLRTAATFGRWDAMMAVLDARIGASVSPRERVDLLVRGADLRLEQFLDAPRAVEMLEEALDLDSSEQRAYAILSRAYRHLRRFDALVSTYERHLGAATSLSDKASIYGQLGEALIEAGENERAIDAFRNQADIDERNLTVLEVLAKLYEKTGDTVQALDSYQRLGDRLVEPKRRAEAFVRAAQILDERLGDRVEARQMYLRAIDANQEDLAAIRWLARFATDDGDFSAAARFLDREQSLLVEPIERASCLVRLADVRARYLDDPQGATFALETAFELDPDSEAASERLVDGFMDAQQWSKARACLELLTRKAGHRAREEQHDLFVKLGKVCVELGADDKALRAFTAAHQLDANDHPLLLVMADAATRLHDANTALAHLQKLVAVAPSHDVELLVEAYAKMGAVRREQAQARMAIAAYEKALALEPTHRASLRGVIELYAEAQDWRQVVAFKRQELDATYDGDARFTLLVEIADVLVDKEKNVAKAVDALEEARDLRPNELPLLHRLMALYQQLEDWRRVIETVERIIAAETDPVRRSRYVYTVAQLYRDKEQDSDRALQLFEEALDANPRLLEAFERVNKILTQRKDWKSLERAFRRMIKRLQAASITEADLHFNLWHNLGLIYRDRLVEPNAAIEAFKMATQHKPDEAVERQILAELYESTGQIESAVGEHSLVLAKDPLRIDPYRSLYKLYARQRDADRAWCMSSALVFLKKADDDERRYFEAHRGEGLPKIRARLDNENWVRSVFHKDDNVFVGKIFEMIAPAAAKARMNQLAATRQLPVLEPKARQDASSTVTAITTLRWASDVLGLRAPDLYLQESDPNAFVHAGVAPSATFVGQRVLSGASPLEIAFLAGRHMAMHRGEHVIRTLFPTYLELKVLFFAALTMVRPDFEVEASIAAAVKATSADLERLIETREKENLRVVVQRFVESGQQADLKRWVQAVEFSSCRAGFLLCGDLEVARRMILAEPTVAGDPSPQDKLREVMLFAVSDAYFTLRKALGFAIA